MHTEQKREPRRTMLQLMLPCMIYKFLNSHQHKLNIELRSHKGAEMVERAKLIFFLTGATDWKTEHNVLSGRTLSKESDDWFFLCKRHPPSPVSKITEENYNSIGSKCFDLIYVNIIHTTFHRSPPQNSLKFQSFWRDVQYLWFAKFRRRAAGNMFWVSLWRKENRAGVGVNLCTSSLL